MATSELSVMLTAKGNLESELKNARDRVKELSKEIRTTQTNGGQVGDKLAREFQQATRAAERLGREVNDTNRRIKTAASQSSNAAAKIGRAWKKTANVFSNNMVAGISAVSVALAGRQAIRAYAEAEKMQMQLNFAYSKFPAIANVTRESFDALNTALMNTTGADDDALAATEGMLARFQLTGTEIQKLIPLVNDLSIATGQDLQSSATAVGRAMMGNARGLKAIGIDFKATGDKAKDTATVMQLLTDKVGGTGEAFGKTTAGQMAIAQENFSNLQETIGVTLVPALTALISIVKPVTEWFQRLSAPVRTAGIVIVGIGVAALIATPRIIAMQAAMKLAGINASGMTTKLKGAGSFLMGPWGAALAAGALALGYFMEQSAQADARVQEFANSIDTATGKLNQAGIAKVANQLMKDISAEDWQTLEKLGYGVDAVTAAIISGDSAWRSFNDSVNQTRLGISGFDRDKEILSTLQNNAYGLRKDVQAGADAFAAAGKAADIAGVPISDLGYAMQDTGDAASDTEEKVSALTKAINRLSGAVARQRALKDFKKSLKASITKPSADAARDMVDSFASAYATFKDGSRAQARFVEQNYGRIVKAIENSGIKGKQKQDLIDPLIKAKQAADEVLNKLTQLDGTSISIKVQGVMNATRKASGGLVTGPGTGTSDSIPALLSNGEYVIRARAAQTIGLANLNKLNQADKMTDPALLDRMAVQGTPVPVSTQSAPLIGSIVVNNPAASVDVEKAVVHGLARARRIQKERG